MTGAVSIPFLILAASSSFVLWIFRSHKTKPFVIGLCNLVFLVLLKASVVDVAYILALVAYTWAMGNYLTTHSKTTDVLLSVSVPVLGLCFFKYAGYLSFAKGIWMPLGLSFYSFKAISYLCDVASKKTHARNPLAVFDYLVFFPAYFAGPIHRSEPFFQELETDFVFRYIDQKNGCVQAVFGLFQKMVIADELSILSSSLLAVEKGGWYTVLGMLAYSFYIYVDFDSYSNFVIGIARMMGIHLERNFHTPYLASDLQEFWRRWHISLSSWLKDYVYIPLGGSRHGKIRKAINTILVFLVSGIWHGSTLMFVWWGLGHGILNVIESTIRSGIAKLHLPKWTSYGWLPIGIGINLILVTALWVFFRAPSMADALNTFQKMALCTTMPLSAVNAETVGIPWNEWVWMFLLFGMVVISDLARYATDMVEWLSKRPMILRWFVYILLMVIAMIFGVYGPGYHPQDFIYVTF